MHPGLEGLLVAVLFKVCRSWLERQQ